MATPLGNEFSTVENQVSQCDEQTFGSISEFKEANAARVPLAKSAKQVSAETGKALCEPTAVLWVTKKQARSASLLLLRTWSFTSTKENLKKSSLGVV